MQVDTSETAFRAWLQKNAYVEVGRRSDPRDCAFARFLKDNGFYAASVGGTQLQTTRFTEESVEQRVQRTPRWLQNFISQFDRSNSRAVTGMIALTYLEPEHGRAPAVPKEYEPKQGGTETLPWGGSVQRLGKVAWEDAPIKGGGSPTPVWAKVHAYAGAW